MNLKQLKNNITRIGQKIVKCPLNCEGIENKKEEGIIPRGLYLETQGRDSRGKGVIVVGMNPGKMDKNCQECKDILKDRSSYQNFTKAFEKNVLYNNSYCKKTKEILNILGFTGPILWTNTVKCQSKENGKLTLSTIRKCAYNFLKKEVDLFENSYPILTLGDKAYHTCLLIFPERIVIKSYHVSGSNSGFPSFLEGLKRKKSVIRNKVTHLKGNDTIILKDFL